MRTFTFQCENEAQFTALQQAAHFLAEMHQLAQAAPSGAIRHTREGQALDCGRQFLRVTPCSPLPNNASTRTKKKRRQPLRVRRVVPT